MKAEEDAKISSCPIQLLFLRSRWINEYPALGAKRFEELASYYSEPHRYYHTLWHIADFLNEFEEVPLVLKPRERKAACLAVWYHDAVYNPTKNDNEEQSALIAESHLTQAGMSDIIGEVLPLIIATKHIHLPENELEDMIVDADLSILGRDNDKYRHYAHAIRQEYSMYSEKDYRSGRATFMAKFLKRKNLFHTTYFQGKYETMARKNLTEELDFLRGKRPLKEYCPL